MDIYCFCKTAKSNETMAIIENLIELPKENSDEISLIFFFLRWDVGKFQPGKECKDLIDCD